MKVFISVLIRSFNRVKSLSEIVTILLNQTYRNFEIVIVDQSNPEQWELLTKSELHIFNHPQIKLIKSEPLGPAGARNLGVVHCAGDVILFMDDDDLPIGRNWIQAHGENYRDPHCIGVSGRDVFSLQEKHRYQNMSNAVDHCLTYSFFYRARVFTGITKYKKPVEWLHGSNASIRKEYIYRAEGWYPYLNDNEEHSFCFKLRRIMNPEDYLAFDPAPLVLRRMTLAGGVGRRKYSFVNFLSENFKYYHWVVAKYHPVRFYFLYPLFILYSITMTRRGYKKSLSYLQNKIAKQDKFYLLLSPIIALKYLVSCPPKENGHLSLQYFISKKSASQLP